MKNKNKQNWFKRNKAVWIAPVTGAMIGAIYSVCPWIVGGIFHSWGAVVPFAPAFFTFVLFSDALGINDKLAIGISITLWVIAGILVGLIINKIRVKK
jgi:ribose/xylose/arabinose/galactoside ABC-type transport system permease subunit